MDARTKLGLPYRPFLYTLDQICDLFQLSRKEINNYLFLPDLQIGTARPDRMACLNIAPNGLPPQWRVEERELIRWMKYNHVSLLSR